MEAKGSIAVLFCTHNRISKTDNFIVTFNLGKTECYAFDLWACDDGSKDGTPEKLKEYLNDAHILNGDGKTFWNKSMAKLLNKSMEKIQYRGFLLANDDISLFSNWGERFSERIALFPNAILVGEFVDPLFGNIVYGGLNSSRANPMKFNISRFSDSIPRMVDVAHANFLYIPRSVLEKIGSLDEYYAHGFGDFDITLRATMAGIPVITMGVIGECEPHILENLRNPMARLAKVLSIKNLPIKSQFRFAFRFGRYRGLLFMFNPYLRALLNIHQRSDAGGYRSSITPNKDE